MERNIIAFVAGKSGGHILPCLNLAQQHKNTDSTSTIIFFTSPLPLDKKIIQADKNVSLHIPLALYALPSSIFKYPLFFWYIVLSVCKSFITFIDHRPTHLITTGGIVAIPTVMTAWLLRIPIHIYILDAKPGKAIRFVSGCTTRLYYCFKNTVQHIPTKKAYLCTYPSGYTKYDYNKSPQTARLTLGLHSHKKTLCILGGSQGSLFINEAIVNWIESNSHQLSGIQIIHQTGSQDTRPWHTIYPKYGIKAYVFDYRHTIGNMYAAADLIICRAGAGTLFEIQAFGKKGLIIPLETQTNNHQLDNAYAMINQFPNQFKMIRQQVIEQEPELFFNQINELLETPVVNSQSHETISTLEK